jgi:hypothetical protein
LKFLVWFWFDAFCQSLLRLIKAYEAHVGEPAGELQVSYYEPEDVVAFTLQVRVKFTVRMREVLSQDA